MTALEIVNEAEQKGWTQARLAEALKATGYMCNRCRRLLAPGARCPTHGKKRSAKKE